MRTAVVVLLLVLAGCSGSKDGSKSKSVEAAFALEGPAGPVEVLNGATARTAIELRWKAGSPEDVTLAARVEPAEQGVSVKLGPEVLSADQAKAQLVIRCSETARAGDYKVIVTGKAAKAGTATKEITVKVPPID